MLVYFGARAEAADTGEYIDERAATGVDFT
jgi:hypothetical protein